MSDAFQMIKRNVLISCQCIIARVPPFGKFKLFFVDRLKISNASWYVFYVLTIGIDNSWKEIARKEGSFELDFLLEILYNGC